MTDAIEKPDFVTEEHLEYLDDLRDSGVTNMLGAGAYVQATFDETRQRANKIVTYWMKTYAIRKGLMQ